MRNGASSIHPDKEKPSVDDLILIGLLIALAYWAYRSGKRTGSIQGFSERR